MVTLQRQLSFMFWSAFITQLISFQKYSKFYKKNIKIRKTQKYREKKLTSGVVRHINLVETITNVFDGGSAAVHLPIASNKETTSHFCINFTLKNEK